MEEMKDLACPACGFMTIDETTYGTYVICRVCGWEDDPVQLGNPCDGGGANSESLHEAQLEALARYPISQREALGYRRDNNWRPLNDTEIEVFKGESQGSRWNHRSIEEPGLVYWLKS